MRFFLVLLICNGSMAHVPVLAQGPESADQALLDDLDADPLNPSKDDEPAVLDQELLEQLGEDVGASQSRSGDWLSRVVKHMKTAENILEDRSGLTRASDSQTEALTSLDTMIAELTQRKSQCQGRECKQSDKPKPGQKSKPNGKAGTNPAQSTSTTTNADADLSTEFAVAGEMVKDLWGKLPQRQRQQILQPLSEEFLPKYASEIEAYFRALAQPKPNDAEPR